MTAKTVLLGLIISVNLFADDSYHFNYCKNAEPRMDFNCKVISAQNENGQSIFELSEVHFCGFLNVTHHQDGNGPAYDLNNYHVIGGFKSKYLPAKESRDGVMPGRRNAPTLKQGDESERSFSQSYTTKTDGSPFYNDKRVARVDGNVLTGEVIELNGMDLYYQMYKTQVVYDMNQKTLELAFFRDYHVIPFTEKWKQLYQVRLKCQ